MMAWKGDDLSNIDDRIAELGLVLPESVPPAGSYLPAYQAGNLVFTSAVGPRTAEGTNITGLVPRDISVEDAYQASRRTGLRILTNLKSVIKDLGRVTHVVKVSGMVQATEDFNEYAKVVNGCSDLFVEIFGDAGKHARGSMGVTRNPFDGVVSNEAIFEGHA
jgi:enamine deaminase RidA (YjgF/YER057c/UK114 family)